LRKRSNRRSISTEEQPNKKELDMPAQSSISVELDAPSAYARVMSAVQTIGGQIKMQTPPQSAQFGYVLKNLWKTGGMAVKFDGAVNVQPVSDKLARVTTNVKVDFGSAVPYFLTLGVCGLFALVLGNGGMLILLCLLGGAVYSYIEFNTKTPEEICQKIAAALPVTTMAYTPPPGAAPMASPPPSATSAEAGIDIAAQIKKLAELRDMGALTTGEFDAKKAELLKRL
jgi:hypothetical protein